eukprot:maker-scaffold1538_size36768-snap-gene-0.12 protein:Tk08907 transcript:maker-scaffold1538_size36768-snap-gene-0.12-mRNA-1 annotation:"hypothetical protein AaeL_AAEL003041"
MSRSPSDGSWVEFEPPPPVHCSRTPSGGLRDGHSGTARLGGFTFGILIARNDVARTICAIIVLLQPINLVQCQIPVITKGFLAALSTQNAPPPVEILRQINDQHEDGSYTYGYEAADGSFKLETRFPDGLVQGKYGYVDIDSGELKVIEYGADMMGFQPVGDLPFDVVNLPGTSTTSRTTTSTTTTTTATATAKPFRRPERKNMRRNKLLAKLSYSRNPSQVRGLELEQPITRKPLIRRPLARVPIKGRRTLVNFSEPSESSSANNGSTKRSRQVLPPDDDQDKEEPESTQTDAESRNLPQMLPPSPLSRPILPLAAPRVAVNFDYLIQEFTGMRTMMALGQEGDEGNHQES